MAPRPGPRARLDRALSGRLARVASREADFERALEFERAAAAAASTLVEDVGVGTLYVNDRLPGVWDRNYLRLDERARGAPAAHLAALTDARLAAAGAEHRKIYAPAGDLLDDVLEEFGRLGWTRTDLATMAHRDTGALRVQHAIEELDSDSYVGFESLCVAASPAADPKVKDQLVSLVPLMARAARARFFAARASDGFVAGCHLYSDGDVAQVEDVMTLEPHRRRGYGGSVVSRAVEAAFEDGHALVFLIVEQEGAAHDFYERLGFEDVGRTIELALEPR